MDISHRVLTAATASGLTFSLFRPPRSRCALALSKRFMKLHPVSIQSRVRTSVLATANFSNQDSEVLEAAWEILEEFNRNDVKRLQQPSLESPDGRFALQASLLAAVQASRAQDGSLPLLGICAGNVHQAIAALRQWTSALSCEFHMPQVIDSSHDLNTLPGSVYIKYNPQAKNSYIRAYGGEFRGVIVQIGQKQVGHLPLSLFDL